MKKNKPEEFLQQNINEIKSDYDKIKDSNFENFDVFFDFLLFVLEKLQKDKANKVSVASLVSILSEKDRYNNLERKYLQRWLFEALLNETTSFYVIEALIYYNSNEVEEARHPDISPLRTTTNEDLCEHYLGLEKCKSFIEKREFLEDRLIHYADQLVMAKNDRMNTTQNFRPEIAAAFGLNYIERYNSMIELTKVHIKNIEYQEDQQLFRSDEKSYFINESIIGQLFDLLVNEPAFINGKPTIIKRVNDEDQNKLKKLLKFGKPNDEPIKINLRPKQLSHSFYQLAYNEPENLIQRGRKDLAAWLSSSFKPVSRKGEYEKVDESTLKRYINERRKLIKGQELFEVVKIPIKTKNGPTYRLEEVLVI